MKNQIYFYHIYYKYIYIYQADIIGWNSKKVIACFENGSTSSKHGNPYIRCWIMTKRQFIIDGVIYF